MSERILRGWQRLRQLGAGKRPFESQQHANRRPARLTFESLEQRQLLAVSQVSLQSDVGRILIHGTQAPDNVVVTSQGGSIRVQASSGTQSETTTFPSNQVVSINFSGGRGDDRFVNSTALPATANGQDGNDEIIGGGGDDLLVGGDGNDRIFGNAGNDTLHGEAGEDQLDGQAGNDELFGGGDNDQLIGGPGDDSLHGQSGDDLLFGMDGGDRLNGNTGDDILVGGFGDDNLFGELGADRLFGEAGVDNLNGGDGDDELDGGSGDDELLGGPQNDLLLGGDGHDSLHGQSGNDRLNGQNGNDRLNGNSGDDVLNGGPGSDNLFGELGNDRLFGEAGEDHLNGAEGIDELDGGGAADELRGGSGDDLLLGRGGNDVLISDLGNDVLIGGPGSDELDGRQGDDLLIGSTTAYDLRMPQLRTIRNVWSSNLDYDTRLDLLTDEKQDIHLIAQDTVLQDFVPDELTGGDGQDWFFQPGTVGIYNPLAASTMPEDSPDDHDGDTTVNFGDLTPFVLALTDSLLEPTIPEPERLASCDFTSDGLCNFGDLAKFTELLTNPVSPAMTGHHVATASHHNVPILDRPPQLEGFDLIDALDDIRDARADEQIGSQIPHPDNATKRREHISLFELVRYDEVSHTAVTSGAWSNPSTWQDGILPAAGARVLIPVGVEVNVAQIVSTKLATVRVDGVLSFATNQNSELRADTVVVSVTGSFRMGTAEQAINPAVNARLLITDSGPIDRTQDPFGLGRGFISHGSVSIYGSEVASHAEIRGGVRAGARQLVFANSPTGWRVGDQIVIAGTAAENLQNEVRRILAIDGNRVTVNGLSHDHLTPRADLSVHVANLSRNAVIESEAFVDQRRGHVMFMHNRDVNVFYAGFVRMGRSEKLKVVNDPVVDDEWNLQPGTGSNPRGRYSVHFHRNGVHNDGNPAIVHGSAVVDSSGWGYVNHNSFVIFSDNVAFGVRGAAFATEVGDEIGAFRANLAIGTTGSGAGTDSRVNRQDFGHQGDGFWFQGSGVSVTENISAANEGNAFIFYTRGFRHNNQAQTFLAENLVHPEIAGGAETIPVNQTPIREFRRNVGYASATGLTLRYHLENASHPEQSVVEASSFWNNTTGVDLLYTKQTILRDLEVIHAGAAPPDIGLRVNDVTADIVYENLTVIGYRWGLDAPRRGTTIVRGGHFDNRQNVVVQTGITNDRSVLITGSITFGNLSQSDVYLRSDFRPRHERIDYIFTSDQVTLDYGPYRNQRAYWSSQRADAVPFSAARASIPGAYVGLSNQVLKSRFNLAVGGEIAPSNATERPRVDGLVAPRP